MNARVFHIDPLDREARLEARDVAADKGSVPPELLVPADNRIGFRLIDPNRIAERLEDGRG